MAMPKCTRLDLRRATDSEQIRHADANVDLSVVIPTLNDSADLPQVLPELRRVLEGLQVSYELLVVTAAADDQTLAAVAAVRGMVLEPAMAGYSGALITGFAAARGEYILTMDADTSHPAVFVEHLWSSGRMPR
jgi:glycosyltransferase involved in cell wall biosynthesis